MLECILKRNELKRLNNINEARTKNVYTLTRLDSDPKKIIKKITEYTHKNNKIDVANLLAYRAIEKAKKFAEHLDIQKNDETYKRFMYNAGMERIKPFTNEILTPLNITQEQIIKKFEEQYRKQ